MGNKQKTILIGMPSYGGLIPATMVQSLLQLHKPLPCSFMIVERQRIDKARNVIALEVIRGGFDYLFFVDDDNPIPPDTLEKFIDDDKDIVVAPILGRNPNGEGVYPLCAFYAERVRADGGELNIYRNITEFKDDGYLHEIDAGGTGCMLIKRVVLEGLYRKYKEDIFEFGEIKFKEKMTVDGVEYEKRTMSEDCEFSERAKREGFEIWLDDRVKPLHITNYNLVQYKG